MSAKHTPGPWEFFDDMDEITTTNRMQNNKVCIAIVETGWSEPFESEQQANARLIAAAPDLLATVKGLLLYFESGNSVPVQQATIRANSPWVLDALAAVAKVEGSTP